MNMESAQKTKTHSLTFIGLLSALLCVLAPISAPVPFSPVPISLATLAIYFCAIIGGAKRGTVSVIVYLLIGSIGVPVFAGWTAGFQKIAGPTGGYLLGYLFMAAIAGYFVDQFEEKIPLCLLGILAGTAVCYLFGTIWLAKLMGLSFGKAFLVGIVPYLPGDAIKIALSILCAFPLRKRLKAAGML